MKFYKKLLKVVGWVGRTPLIEDDFKEPRGPHDYYYGPDGVAYWFTEMKAFQYQNWFYIGVCPKTQLLMRLKGRNNYTHELNHREVDIENVYELRVWEFEPPEVQTAYKKWVIDREAEKAIFG